MNNWMDYAKAAADMAATLTKQYGPEAWETILWIQRIEAIQNLTLPILIWPLFYLIVKPLWLKWWKFTEKYSDEDKMFARVLTSIVASAAASPLLVWCTLWTLNVWTWVQLFKPDLYLAKTLIDKVIN